MYYRTRKKLEEVGIKYENHTTRKMTTADYKNYDYIIGMEDSNIRNILRVIEKNSKNKIFKLLYFTSDSRDTRDS